MGNTPTHTHTHTHTHTRARARARARARTNTYARTHARTHAHTYRTHEHMYTYTHCFTTREVSTRLCYPANTLRIHVIHFARILRLLEVNLSYTKCDEITKKQLFNILKVHEKSLFKTEEMSVYVDIIVQHGKY